MTCIIALANHKGGVGKTSSTISIGVGLGRLKKKVLLIDLDPQANLTQCLGIEPPEFSIYHALRGDVPLPVIEGVRKNIDLAASNLDLAGAEVELANKMARETILKKILEPFRSRYDYILIDCPPSLGLLCINALAVADKVYIPQQAQFLSLHGIDKLIEIVGLVKNHFNPQLKIGGVFITQYSQRKVLNRDMAELVRTNFGDVIFKTIIRDNVALAEAPSVGMDIFQYAPDSYGAKDYSALVKEIVTREEGAHG